MIFHVNERKRNRLTSIWKIYTLLHVKKKINCIGAKNVRLLEEAFFQQKNRVYTDSTTNN